MATKEQARAAYEAFTKATFGVQPETSKHDLHRSGSGPAVSQSSGLVFDQLDGRTQTIWSAVADAVLAAGK